MSKRQPSKDLVVAYHEAGHAAAAWEERVGLRKISLVPSQTAAGYMRHAPIFSSRYNPEWSDSPQVRIRGERLIRVCLAGPIAQHKFSPRSWRRWHGDSDFAQATDMILRLAAPGEHADTYMKLLDIEARMIVDKHWPLIEALAAELIVHRTMTGTELNAFIRGRLDAFAQRRP